jgi:hypothetical protein
LISANHSARGLPPDLKQSRRTGFPLTRLIGLKSGRLQNSNIILDLLYRGLAEYSGLADIDPASAHRRQLKKISK